MQDGTNNDEPRLSDEKNPDSQQIEGSAVEDWADNESVTTDDGGDEESTNPPPKKKKNIHLRRFTLTPQDSNGSFIIEGGRRPKEVNMSPLGSDFYGDQTHLLEADFVLERLAMHRSHGRNGHVSVGVYRNGYSTRTLETMAGEFKRYQAEWLKSAACVSLRGTIRDLKKQDGYVRIDNIVCLALGSLQDTTGESRGRSLTQLAVLMTITELLDLDPHTMPGKFVAQDPSFTPLDAEFLATLGFTVVSDPEGFLAITTNTLVYSIAGYLDMDWVISYGPWPAALVCGDTEAFMRRVEEDAKTSRQNLVYPTKKEQGEILAMLSGCEIRSLVGEGENVEGWDSIDRQRIYWRRKDDGV